MENLNLNIFGAEKFRHSVWNFIREFSKEIKKKWNDIKKIPQAEKRIVLNVTRLLLFLWNIYLNMELENANR